MGEREQRRQLVSAAQPAVGAAHASCRHPIDFKLNTFSRFIHSLTHSVNFALKEKKQKKRPLRAELPPVVINYVDSKSGLKHRCSKPTLLSIFNT